VEQEYISGSRLLYVSGYALIASPIREAVFEAVEIASRSDIPIFFDPGPKLTRIPIEMLKRLISASRVVLLNEREMDLIEETDCTWDSARELLQKGPKAIVLKRGPEGCWICTDCGLIEVPGHRVRVVDTTGAGDAFNATFVYGYLRGWSYKKSAVLANAVGAVKVTKMGTGVKVPTKEEIKEFLSKNRIDLDDF
jgi:sugar/nucleoside kinase (ribokinase family)